MSEKIKKILEKNLEENNLIKRELDYRLDLLKSISFENQLVRVLGLSSIFYLSLFTLFIVFVSLPIVICPFLILSSIGGSFLINKYLIDKFDNKRKVAEFSKAHTISEVQEEIIKYTFERERFFCRGQVNQMAVDIFNEQKKLYDKVSKDYELVKRKNNEVDNKLINSLDEKMRVNYSSLDKISKKRTLNENFYMLRNKFNNFESKIRYSMLSGLMFMLIMSMPLMVEACSPMISLITILSSSLVGFVSPIIYLNKQYKMYEKILRKLNIDFKESDYTVDINVNKLINEMAMDTVKLLEYKEQMEIYDVQKEEEKTENMQIVRQESFVFQEEIKEDVIKLGLNKKYPN